MDIALKALDYDHDNRISFSDFEQTIKKDKYLLMMELLGPCLPQDSLRDAYEATYCAPANKQLYTWFTPHTHSFIKKNPQQVFLFSNKGKW